MIGSVFAFCLKYRRLLLPLAVAAGLAFTTWRAADAAYERGFAAAQNACRTAAAEAESKARAQREVEQNARERITYEAGFAAGAAQRKIETITRTLIEKVPTHVSSHADSACVVPFGFVRLHDAAAGGRDVPAIPGAAGQSDDRASGVALSAVAATMTGNYGTCHAVRRQLIDLQAWIAAQQTAIAP